MGKSILVICITLLKRILFSSVKYRSSKIILAGLLKTAKSINRKGRKGNTQRTQRSIIISTLRYSAHSLRSPRLKWLINTPGGSKNCNVRVLFTFLFFTVLLNPVCSQPLNYREVFGDDWKNAVSFEKENRNWMKPALEKYHISYPVAIAVVFPELVRYSALRDKMVITLLKTLYINLGSDYANFSIGRFQMKPSLL